MNFPFYKNNNYYIFQIIYFYYKFYIMQIKFKSFEVSLIFKKIIKNQIILLFFIKIINFFLYFKYKLLKNINFFLFYKIFNYFKNIQYNFKILNMKIIISLWTGQRNMLQ